MDIRETGEVREHVRLPKPEEAEAFEVDVPQPVQTREDVGWRASEKADA